MDLEDYVNDEIEAQRGIIPIPAPSFHAPFQQDWRAWRANQADYKNLAINHGFNAFAGLASLALKMTEAKRNVEQVLDDPESNPAEKKKARIEVQELKKAMKVIDTTRLRAARRLPKRRAARRSRSRSRARRRPRFARKRRYTPIRRRRRRY